jgi:hypothetical protein
MTEACLARCGLGASRCTSVPAGHRCAPRWRRAVAGWLAGLALAAVLAGCAALGAALSVSTALGQAGYDGVSVNVASGAGLPVGGLVQVSYSSGPAGSGEEAAARAERIVWDSYAARFGAVAVFKVSGGCTGPVCATESRQIADATYSQLSSEFGPRPRGLHGASLMSVSGVSGWDIAAAVMLFVSVIATAVVVRRRRRRRGPSSWPGSPGSPGSWPQPGQRGT